MNEYKLKLLNYIFENYNDVVIEAQGGPYIEVDLIPNSHDGMHDLTEIIMSSRKTGIDLTMFTRSYPTKEADGIRMGRYFYFMQETTSEILNDLNEINK